MWPGELLQGLLQVLQPADQQVAVLQHQPVAPGGRCLQQLESNLEGKFGRTVIGFHMCMYVMRVCVCVCVWVGVKMGMKPSYKIYKFTNCLNFI